MEMGLDLSGFANDLGSFTTRSNPFSIDFSSPFVTQMKQYYRTPLTSLRLRVDRPLSVVHRQLSVHHPLSVHRSLSVHRQNISNGFKRIAMDRMFFYK